MFGEDKKQDGIAKPKYFVIPGNPSEMSGNEFISLVNENLSITPAVDWDRIELHVKVFSQMQSVGVMYLTDCIIFGLIRYNIIPDEHCLVSVLSEVWPNPGRGSDRTVVSLEPHWTNGSETTWEKRQATV